MRLETREQFLVGSACRRALVHDDDVESGKLILVLAKRFPNDPLYPVSTGRPAAVFFRYRKPQPSELEIVSTAQYGKPVVATSRGFVEDTIERRSIEQPVVFRKPVRRFAFQWNDLPAVATAACNYGVSFARPLARRRFSTRRPALVAMRARKPCVRARFSLLG